MNLRALLPTTVAVAATALLTASSAFAAGNTYYVAPGGSDAVACSANSATSPFATIQQALTCTSNGDTISLAPSGSTPYPGIGTISDDVTIAAQSGANASSVTVDAGQGELAVSPGATVTVTGVDLNCITSGCNSAPAGPVVTNEGTLTLSGDTVTGSGVFGGITNTTPANSSTDASLTIEDSSVTGNVHTAPGGGVYSQAGGGSTGSVSLTIVNSTIANDLSTGQGGGVFVGAIVDTGSGANTANIVNSTIAGNTGRNTGGGLDSAGTTTLSNTIIASNSLIGGGSDVDCGGTTIEIVDGPGGHNLIGNGTGCGSLVDLTDGDRVGVPDPGFVTTTTSQGTVPALADNGGPTDTIALQAASPAIGAGDTATCLSSSVSDSDQRGDARHTATRGCDIGAYDTGGGGGVPTATFYVAPGGSDSVACSANSATSPFATIQRAISCSTGGDLIELAPSGSTPYPGIGAVSTNVAIQAQPGANARSVTVDAGQGQLSIAPGTSATVSGVDLDCITGGCAGAPQGPAVTNEGTLSLSGDTVTGATNYGGITNTTPADSSTDASLTIEDSAVIDNGIAGSGGGIYSQAGAGATGSVSLTVANSTIADNVSTDGGGGVFASAAGSQRGFASIVNSTIVENKGQNTGGGVDIGLGHATLSNTIVAQNTLGAGGVNVDCAGSTANLSDGPGGHNLIGNGSGCGALAGGVDGDQIGTAADPINPDLAALGWGGGPTETAPELSGSPASGAGDVATCEGDGVFGVDERGDSRNAGARGACDIGADDNGGLSVSAVKPVAIAPGVKNLAVTITGTGFSSGATLSAASGAAITFSSVVVKSATEITAHETAGASVPIGSYALTVTEPNNAATCQGCLSVQAPPVILSLAPATLAQGASAVTLTVDGSGFLAPATLKVTGPGTGVTASVTASSVTPSSLTAKVTVPASAATGAYTVKLTNGDGATATFPGSLTVVAGPTINAVSPATLSPGEMTTFTVTGTGFSSDAKVTGPKGVTINGVTVSGGGTTLTAKATVGKTAAAGSNLPVTVTDGPLGDDGSTTAHVLTIT